MNGEAWRFLLGSNPRRLLRSHWPNTSHAFMRQSWMGYRKGLSRLRSCVLQWLADGEVGISSRAIALATLGADMTYYQRGIPYHPHDPDDLRRCLLLLERCPGTRKGVELLAEGCPVWKALHEHWEELDSLFRMEVGEDLYDIGFGKRAEQTYDRMKEIGC